jgi:mRNA interferase RelE/StbE
MYDVILMPEAARAYQKAQVALARRLKRCLDVLSDNPRAHPNIKRLSGHLQGLWRYRLGVWRIVYAIDEDQRCVKVLVIAHRREVYR